MPYRLRGWRWRSRWGGGSRRTRWSLFLALVGLWIGYRLLAGIWTIFEHAFLNSYYYVPGPRVAAAYWGAVRFAFDATILITALAAVLATLAVLQLSRWPSGR